VPCLHSVSWMRTSGKRNVRPPHPWPTHPMVPLVCVSWASFVPVFTNTLSSDNLFLKMSQSRKSWYGNLNGLGGDRCQLLSEAPVLLTIPSLKTKKELLWQSLGPTPSALPTLPRQLWLSAFLQSSPMSCLPLL
jgi:hypothetical protein